MTKADALVYIIRGARRERCSKTMYKQTCKALDALGIEEPDKNLVLTYLDYHHPDTKAPYPFYV